MKDNSTNHTKMLLERLGRAAHQGWGLDPLRWDDLQESARARWRNVAKLVYDALRTRGDTKSGSAEVAYGYGLNTRRAYVEIALEYSPLQMTPGDARKIAMLLLSSAEAAEADEQLFPFATTEIGLDLQRAGQMLDALRKMRGGQQ